MKTTIKEIHKDLIEDVEFIKLNGGKFETDKESLHLLACIIKQHLNNWK